MDIKNPFSRNNIYHRVFILSLLVLFAVFFFLFVWEWEGDQINIFFRQGEDFMADFFNVAKYVSEKNPYLHELNGPGEKAYLPISYVIMYLFSKLADYRGSTPMEAGFSTSGLISCVLFMFFTSTFLFLQIYELQTNNRKMKKFFITLCLFLSGIFIFTFERGNLIILTVCCSTFFLAFYDSESKGLRELSYLALALAAGLKGYPALLGILLLYEKRFVETARLAVYGIAVAVLPFLFFENGLANIGHFLNNLPINGEVYRYTKFARFGPAHLFAYNLTDMDSIKTVVHVGEAVTAVLSVLSVLIAPALKEAKWKVFGILTCVIIMFPTNSALYCGLYFIPIIALFFNEKKHKPIDYAYLVCFIVFLCPLQLVDVSPILPNLALFVVWMILITEGWIKSFVYVKGYIAGRKLDKAQG